MSEHPYTYGCECQECVIARRLMVEGSHPILKNKNAEIRAGPIPPEMALAYRLEEREILEAQLAVNAAEIKILRDCGAV